MSLPAFSSQTSSSQGLAVGDLAVTEAVRYFAAHGSHCVLFIDATKKGAAKVQDYSVPFVALTADALDWQNRIICKEAVIVLGKDGDVMDSWIAQIPVSDSIIFIADSTDTLNAHPRLRRLPKSLYFVTNSADVTNRSNIEHYYPFAVYARPDYFDTLKEVALYREGSYHLANVMSKTVPNMMPRPQLDYGGGDFPAVAFQFYPYSMPDFETQKNHAGFEYEIVSILARYPYFI